MVFIIMIVKDPVGFDTYQSPVTLEQTGGSGLRKIQM